MIRAWSRQSEGYLQATRHPLVCVVFVLPLLLIYELGMYWLGRETGLTHRNGADVWLREALAQAGVSSWYAAPSLLIVILLAWGVWRRQRLPDDLVGTGIGMSVESALFAAGLFGISQIVLPLLSAVQRGTLAVQNPGGEILSVGLDPVCQQILRYLGAGLYEETLFRLLLFSAFWGLLLHWEMPMGTAFLGAGLGSALCFSGAHHVGENGEAFHALVFLFRTLAGWYFAWIFYFRGFGIAVGAHALYDVLVGILLRPLAA